MGCLSKCAENRQHANMCTAGITHFVKDTKSRTVQRCKCLLVATSRFCGMYPRDAPATCATIVCTQLRVHKLCTCMCFALQRAKKTAAGPHSTGSGRGLSTCFYR